MFGRKEPKWNSEDGEMVSTKLEALRAALGELAESGLDGKGERASDEELLRFLRARKGDVEKAKEQYEKSRAWRMENNVARFTEGIVTSAATAAAVVAHPVLGCGNIETHPALRLGIPQADEGKWLHWGQTISCGCSKEGHPIHLQHVGRASVRFAECFAYWTKKEGSAAAAKHAVVMGFVHFQEVQRMRMREASERLGQTVTKQVVIMDLDGLSMWPDKNALACFKEFIRVTSTYYPETLAQHFFINAPFIFTGIWAIIKGWLDPVTAQKMHVLGRNFKDTLLQYIEPDQLPVKYGGTNQTDIYDRASTLEEGEKVVAELRQALSQFEAEQGAAKISQGIRTVEL